MNITAAGKESIKQLPGGQALIIVKIHGVDSGKKVGNYLSTYTEMILKDADEIGFAEGRGQRKLRVVKDDVV